MTKHDVRAWLAVLGMPEYSGAFFDNGIDGVFLANGLTDDDFDELGVTSKLQRKKIRLQIQELQRVISSAETTDPAATGSRLNLACKSINQQRAAAVSRPSVALIPLAAEDYSRDATSDRPEKKSSTSAPSTPAAKAVLIPTHSAGLTTKK